MLFAAMHESAYGTSRHFAAPQKSVAIGVTADIGPGSPAAALFEIVFAGHQRDPDETVIIEGELRDLCGLALLVYGAATAYRITLNLTWSGYSANPIAVAIATSYRCRVFMRISK
jgi:hypothetical protein